MARNVTLSELQSQARQRADQENSNFISDSELQGYINASIAELHDMLVSSYGGDYNLDTHFFVTSNSVDEYDLPSDFYKLRGVDINTSNDVSASNGWHVLKPFTFEERNDGDLNFSSRSTFLDFSRYRMVKDSIRFSPTPDGGNAVRLWYVPSAAVLTGSAETLDGVNGFEEYVIVDAAIKMMQKEESDVSVLLAQKAQLQRRIKEMTENRDIGSPDRITDVQYNPYFGSP